MKLDMFFLLIDGLLMQDVFKQNLYNRKKQKYYHKGGAKPFHPTCKEGSQGNEIKVNMKLIV